MMDDQVYASCKALQTHKMARKSSDYVWIRALREALPNIDRGSLDASLRRLHIADRVNLLGISKSLHGDMDDQTLDSALRISRNRYFLVFAQSRTAGKFRQQEIDNFLGSLSMVPINRVSYGRPGEAGIPSELYPMHTPLGALMDIDRSLPEPYDLDILRFDVRGDTMYLWIVVGG